MSKILFSLLIIYQTANAMCEFPHNPAALCLEGSIESSKKISSKNFNCLIKVKVKKLVRPGHVYFFSKDLDRIEVKEPTILKKESIEVYSKDHCSAKSIQALLEYNCSDRYPDIPDLGLLDMNTLKRKVADSWRETKSVIDCAKVLSK